MADDFQRPQRKKNALDNNKITMRAQNKAGKVSSLIFGLINNNPRLTVYTNDPNDTADYGKIVAALDTPMFNALLEMLQEVINTPGTIKLGLRNKNYIYPKGQRSETPVVVSDVLVGRDETGVIWIAVTARNRPMINFQFINPEFHMFIDGDGNAMDKAKASNFTARAYLRLLSQMVNTLQVTDWIEPAPKPQRQGGGGGGGYGGGGQGGGGGSYGGGGGGGRAPAADAASGDDIPW